MRLTVSGNAHKLEGNARKLEGFQTFQNPESNGRIPKFIFSEQYVNPDIREFASVGGNARSPDNNTMASKLEVSENLSTIWQHAINNGPINVHV